MSTTFRQLMNNVLINISEDQIESGDNAISKDYEFLVRNFVNAILNEVQDAHNWSCMRRTCTSTVTAGNGYGSNFQYNAADIPSNSRLARQMIPECGYIRPLAFDVTDAAAPLALQEMDLKEVLYRQTIDSTATANFNWFATDPAANAVVARIHPITTTNRSLQFDFYVPQDEFVADNSDLDTVVNLPHAAVKAVEFGATWFAFEERGEELGTNVMFTEQRYRMALDAAISRDDVEGSGGDYDLVPV